MSFRRIILAFPILLATAAGAKERSGSLAVSVTFRRGETTVGTLYAGNGDALRPLARHVKEEMWDSACRVESVGIRSAAATLPPSFSLSLPGSVRKGEPASCETDRRCRQTM